MKKVTIIASGDSLRGFPFELVKGPIFAINYAACHIPRHDKLCCFDAPRPEYPAKNIETLAQHGGRWINEGERINREPGKVGNMNGSAVFAINIALQLGYKHITLLGCDNAGVGHFYDSPETKHKWNFPHFRNMFRVAAQCLRPGEFVRAVESSLDCFYSVSMEDYLKELTENAD
jgi:hypothetical protein